MSYLGADNTCDRQNPEYYFDLSKEFNYKQQEFGFNFSSREHLDKLDTFYNTTNDYLKNVDLENDKFKDDNKSHNNFATVNENLTKSWHPIDTASPKIAIMDERKEDWEVWDISENNTTEEERQVDDSKEIDEEWQQNSTRSSFTSSYRLEDMQEENAKYVNVYATKTRSISESCDDKTNNLQVDDKKGLTKSFSVLSPGKKKSPVFLRLPFLKKTSSSSSLTEEKQSESSNESGNKLNKSNMKTPTKEKKSSPFSSLIRRKSSSEKTNGDISQEGGIKKGSPPDTKLTSNRSFKSDTNAKNEKVFSITVPKLKNTPNGGASGASLEKEVTRKIDKTAGLSSTQGSRRIQSLQNGSTVSPTKAYSITFTPEGEDKSGLKHKPISPTKSITSPATTMSQAPLLSLVVGVGLSEEKSTSEVMQSVKSPHSVEETGYFSLGGQPPQIITSTPQKQLNVGKDIEFANTGRLNEPVINMPSFNDVTDMDEEDVFNGEETDDATNAISKEDNGKDSVGGFHVLLDTNYDYPNFPTPTKLSASENAFEEFLDTSKVDGEPSNESQIPSPAKVVLEADSDLNDRAGIKRGTSSGQLPTYDELHSTNSDKKGRFSDLAATDIVESVSSSDDLKLREQVKTVDRVPRLKIASHSEDVCDQGDGNDSLISFEQHERDYVNFSPNGIISPAKYSQVNGKGELSADEEAEMKYRDYADGHNPERRMTMEILNFLPDIMEASTEVNAGKINSTTCSLF